MLEVKNQLNEFKKFILRGNVVDLAVGIAIGAAFNGVVTALTKDFITPLIGTVVGKDALATGTFVVRNQTFAYGDFINVVFNFLITAAVIFFVVVQPLNKLVELSNRNKKTEDPTTKKCPECLSEIHIDAKRCKFCTAVIKAMDTPASLKSLKPKKS